MTFPRNDSFWWWLGGIVVAAIAALIFVIAHPRPAKAKDGYDQKGRPLICTAIDTDGNIVMTSEQLIECHRWIRSVQQPNRSMSCCGEADAFEANDFETDANGNLVAVITQDYSMNKMKAYPNGLKPGDRVLIPTSKINNVIEDKNPTDKGIVFLNIDGVVICYLGPWGN